MTPLVGRDEEIALLLRRWEQAKAGEGCVVLIAGEPGRWAGPGTRPARMVGLGATSQLEG
jgi:hypothetical protein